jgi:hypothetical protein
MTEAEWPASADPVGMLASLGDGASRRKLRLFACACFRHGNFGSGPHDAFDRIEGGDGEAGVDDLSRNAPEFARRWAEADGPYFAASAVRAALLREVFGDPFRPVRIAATWLTADVKRLARGAHEGRAFGELPILADALEEAGCDSEALLAHLRSAGPHVRGCWALDLILGKQ